MKIVFVSNYLTLHQIPLCDELYKLCEKNFFFISTCPMDEERINMKWAEKKEIPYEIRSFISLKELNFAKQIINNADVVIFGSADENLINDRISKNKIIIRYSERILKNGRWHVLSPRAIKKMLSLHTKYFNKNIYLFCSSAYASADYQLFGAYLSKSYKWGYFPKTIHYTTEEIRKNKKNIIPSLLWVGRMIKWKHPEVSIKVAEYLKNKGKVFCLTMIGDGPERKKIEEMIIEKRLEDVVKLEKFLSPDKVRIYMENTNVFLFTSDFNEGWGAVLNEAMNSACIVIASHAIGSVPYLIQHKKNGYIYKSGDLMDICGKTEYVLMNIDAHFEMAIQAYNTIINEWNAENAAIKLVEFSKNILENKHFGYKNGILSKSEFLSNHWFKDNN